jgi:hypothetical protein
MLQNFVFCTHYFAKGELMIQPTSMKSPRTNIIINFSEVENHQKLITAIESDTLKQLATLTNELMNAQKLLTKEEHRLNNELYLVFDKASKSFKTLESTLEECKRCIEAQKNITKDPFLAELQCSDATSHLNTAQQEYNKKLIEIYQVIIPFI